MSKSLLYFLVIHFFLFFLITTSKVLYSNLTLISISSASSSHLWIMALLNAFTAHVNSSYGSLDDVWVLPSFHHPFTPLSLTFYWRGDVNVGWCYEGDDPAGSSERFNRTNVTRLLCIPQCWMTLSGNYYLELPQIKDFFLLSQQDQSKQTAQWAAKGDVKITLRISCLDNRSMFAPKLVNLLEFDSFWLELI